jgi:FkbM family methyltransferase
MLGLAVDHTPDLFLDVGGNIGLYSCIIGKNTTIPQIITFECDPRNITMFNAHVYMNGLEKRVTLNECAVGESDGKIDLYLASATSTGKSSVVGPATKDHSVKEVPLRAIDNVVSVKDKTILIKMDIEGFELPALKGMKNILTNNKCWLQVEILPDSNGEATKEYLYETGYVLTHSIGNDNYFRKK